MAFDRPVSVGSEVLGDDETISEPLVITFLVIVLDEREHRGAKLLLAREDQSPQALTLDGEHESLGMGGLRFGDRAGSRTVSTPPEASVSLNALVNNGSRSWMR